MKKILLFLFAFIYINSYAQLDREHWFAPMFDGQSNSGDEQYLHLSTNDTTPFNVNVYNNNVVIAQKTISKGNPGVIFIPRSYIITTEYSDLLRVRTMGLYVKAERPCFANLRFGVINHAEIITSKGTAGIGTKFYTVVAPSSLYNDILGFAASFIATEDNTNVTVNNFKKNLYFTGSGNLSDITFKLNKGESYIIDGRAINSENVDGFIGATVTSDKPVSMTNGNFNGQYASTDTGSGSDILMDQSVPVDKLGDEFVIVKGYGALGNNMEGAIIVATEKNTAIYLNDSTVPFATLANEGDFYFINETNYVDRTNGHYNLHIVTDKNVYVYQLLGGVEAGSSPLATGGMNYIPPLNCYLPQKIDEISYINKIAQNDADNRFVTKLNIITEKGAVVKVNGAVPNPLYGPYDISTITANQSWVTYSIPNVKGNITVVSDKAVTAGIASGNAAFGYGGYFAGFSSIPLITKTVGDCLPGVKLEVTAGFDNYEWLIKAGGVYIPAPGVNNTFEYAPTQAGIYAVKVKQGSCAEIQTRDFKFFNCTTYTNYDFSTCTSQTVAPNFALSTQGVDISTLKVDTPPTKGSVVINPDGTLTYTANLNATGTDTFKFSFCGNGTIPDCETVQATINLNQIEHYDKIFNECSETSTAVFDLTSAPVTPDATVTKKYFTDAAYTNEIPLAQLTNYTSAPAFIYVKLRNTFGCEAEAEIELKITAPPVVTPSLYTQKTCDEDIDGIIDGNYKVNLAAITPTIVQNSTAFTVKYYVTQQQAIDGLINNITGNFTFTADTFVWVRVESPAVCSPVIKKVALTIGTKTSLITAVAIKDVCDLNEDQSEAIVLSDYTALFSVAAGTSATYFNTLSDAQNNQNAINVNQNITSDRTFYYRINVPDFCVNIAALTINLKKGTPSPVLQPSYTVCAGSTTTLDVGTGFPAGILWSTGETTPTITAGVGNYYVDLTNASGCIYRQNVMVIASPKPQWNVAAYDATNCDDDFDGNVKVNLNNVTPLILPNFALFTVKYFSDVNLQNPIADPTNFTYITDTTIYVQATSAYCPAEKRQIDFKVGNSLPLLIAEVTAKVCDDDFDGVKAVNLSGYVSEFTLDSAVSVSYFGSLSDARKKINLISNPVTVANSGSYYLRFHKNQYCDVIGKVSVTIQKAKKSDLLSDEDLYICPEATTVLDAGAGFDAYLWSTGETTPAIEVPVGDYYVDLTSNGCTYRQYVFVKAVALPTITNIEIQGSTVIVNVTGGNPPYQYALDGNNYQASNVFTGIGGGDHSVYVISADHCEPVRADINVIVLYNVITPNNDGVNDVLNYAALLKKEEPFMQIFDRYGKTVFTGDNNNSFIWDGKIFGKAVSTGSYWYVMKWKEPGSSAVTQYSGWILVKNRL